MPKQSEDVRKRRAESLKKFYASPEGKQIIKNRVKGPFLGRSHSKQTRRLISEKIRAKAIKPPNRKGYRKINGVWVKPEEF